MEFEQIVGLTTIMPYILLFIALVIILLGGFLDEFGEYTYIYLGLAWVIISSSFVVLGFGEDYVMDYYGKDKVGVYQVESSTTVVVPKEDEEIVKSLEYTVNELKDKYNTDYTGERYMDKEAVVEIELDTTSGYKIVE